MWYVILMIIGLAVGGLVGWLWTTIRTRTAAADTLTALQERAASAEAGNTELRSQIAKHEQTIATLGTQLDTERQLRVTSETRQEEMARRFEEQKRLLDEAEKKLKESFDALSAKALQTNAEQFLLSARKTLETLLGEARGDLAKRQQAIDLMIKPLGESLKSYEEHLRGLEQNRQKAYGSLEEQVKLLAETSRQLQQETGKLVTSLRDPKVRGQWGEIALRRAAELAGMSAHCDFSEQVTISGPEDARYRPDMIVHLPGGRTVVVDAKAVLDAYLDAVAATDEPQRIQHLTRHSAQIRNRIRELSSKSYWDKLPAAPEFVVLFLPAESFFSAAVEMDRTLIEDAIASRVVLASPTTLIALLRAIAFGWRQEQLAENAERISQLGRDLFERMRTLAEHWSKVGRELEGAVKAYNQSVGSLESRVLPAARRFQELGAAGGEPIPEISPIEHSLRRLDDERMNNA